MGCERALAIAAALILAACAAGPRQLPAAHPASTAATTGRLAGPPAILHGRPSDLITGDRAPAPSHHHGSTP